MMDNTGTFFLWYIVRIFFVIYYTIYGYIIIPSFKFSHYIFCKPIFLQKIKKKLAFIEQFLNQVCFIRFIYFAYTIVYIV